MCPFEDEWQRLCQALERADLLEDARFATSESRRTNDDALASEIEAVFIQRPALEWEKMLTSADVGCVQVEDRGMYHFFSEDPHAEQNAMTVEVEHPRFWQVLALRSRHGVLQYLVHSGTGHSKGPTHHADPQ